jgi:hypothetical protein
MEEEMAFVNERITADDWERYKFPEIERRISVSSYFSTNTCTIDHERGIYLIKAAEERKGRLDMDGRWPTGLFGWVFVWRGHELWAETRDLEQTGESRKPMWSRKRLTSLGLMGERVGMLGSARRLPPELTPRREEILKDLYDALLAYKSAGVLSTCTSYALTLEVAEGI